MKILMLVNWKIKYCGETPADKQPPDYKVEGKDYWFYRYFKNKPNVNVIDIRSFSLIECFERYSLHFYIWQSIRAIPKLNQYDLVVSHGMPSAIVICLWRRFFKTNAKHVVFDIGSFASASESGFLLKLMQFASKSLDGLIYHTSWQKSYYHEFFPWLEDKADFIPFGVDLEFFDNENDYLTTDKYILCVGKNKCDWKTVANAFKKIDTEYKLRLIGGFDEQLDGIEGIEQYSYMPIDKLVEQIKGAYFCVLPIDDVKFSFGQMRFLQQQCMGKCVLAARARSLVDYAIDEKDAVFYEPRNVLDCYNKMNRLLSRPHEVEMVGRNAKMNTYSNFNERNMALAIENKFNKMLKQDTKLQ